ncbi:MAG: apolipoprotein N-acyltransferase, partial [Pseudonocardiaceae bacterium]
MTGPAVTAEDGLLAEPSPARPAGRVWLLRVGIAAGGGALLSAAAPPRELWWLAPVVFAVLWAVLRGRAARAGFGYGFAFGLGFFVPLLSWVGELVGSLPWLALVTVQALVLGLAGAGVALVSRLPAAPLWA